MRILLLLLLFLAPAHAASGAATVFDTSPEGVAMDGYDPVSYFAAAAPAPGDPQIAADWSGATWHFTSTANRDRFLADPEAYAPQYGGWCAWAVGHGYLQPARPTSYAIVRGKLYLNWSPGVQRRWEATRPANIASGNVRWPRLRAELEGSPVENDG